MKEFALVIVAVRYAMQCISTNMTFSSVIIQQKHIQDFKTNINQTMTSFKFAIWTF